MSIQVGDYAIHRDPYRPRLVRIVKVTDKTVKMDVFDYIGRPATASKHMIAAYGPDKAKLEKAVERMVSAKAERSRRAAAATAWLESEMDKIAKEAMA